MSDDQKPTPDAAAQDAAPRTESSGLGEEPIPSELSILPLKDTVVYPGMSVPLVQVSVPGSYISTTEPFGLCPPCPFPPIA